jgi:hypothetical protein
VRGGLIERTACALLDLPGNFIQRIEFLNRRRDQLRLVRGDDYAFLEYHVFVGFARGVYGFTNDVCDGRCRALCRVNIHASFAKRTPPVSRCCCRSFSDTRRISRNLVKGASAEETHDFVDVKGVEYQLGLPQLATLLEVAPQQISSVHSNALRRGQGAPLPGPFWT